MNNVKEFLREYNELLEKYGVNITSCCLGGCHYGHGCSGKSSIFLENNNGTSIGNIFTGIHGRKELKFFNGVLKNETQN